MTIIEVDAWGKSPIQRHSGVASGLRKIEPIAKMGASQDPPLRILLERMLQFDKHAAKSPSLGPWP